MTTTQATHRNSEAAIFGRLWDGGDRLTTPVARHVLTLGFGPEDVARMHALAERCRDGKLTAPSGRSTTTSSGWATYSPSCTRRPGCG